MGAPGPRSEPIIRLSLYRAGWLAVILPALVVLVGARTGSPLPPASTPPTFDATRAASIASELADRFGDRSPGSPGDLDAATYVRDRMNQTLGESNVVERRTNGLALDGSAIPLVNVVGLVTGRGRSRDALLLVAGRDALPPGPGLNDNASATGMLLQLAEVLRNTTSEKSFIFASTDGSISGAAGARELARHPPAGLRPVAALVLRGVGGTGPLRLRLASDSRRFPASGLIQTILTALRGELRDEAGGPTATRVELPGVGEQLANLVVPTGGGEQAPLNAGGIAAVTIDGAAGRASSAGDTSLDEDRLGRVGDAVERIAYAFDSGPQPSSLGASYLVSNDRVLRGWTLQLLLLSLLIPPLVPMIDAVTRASRRGAPLREALDRTLVHAIGPLVALLTIRLLGAGGVIPGRFDAPLLRGADGGVSVWAIVLAAMLGTLAFLLTRHRARLGGRRESDTACYLAALITLFLAALCVLSSSVYLLVLIVPGLHLWLLLPRAARLGLGGRLVAIAAGWLGVAGLVGLLAGPAGFGNRAPAVVVRLAGDGTIPIGTLLALALLAGATITLLRPGDGAVAAAARTVES